MSVTIEKLWKKYQKEKTNETRDQIFNEYTRLVKFLVRKIIAPLPNGLEKEDLIQYGYLGLFEAIEKYDSEKGTFEAFAGYIINGRLIDRIREYGRNSGGLSRTNINKMKAIEKATIDFQKEYGRTPTTEEIAQKIGVDIEKYYKMLNDIGATTTISLDRLIGAEENLSTIEIIKDAKQESPEEIFMKRQRKEIMANSINDLPEDEKLIVQLYYYEKLKLNQIGKIMDKSESRISQLHTQAMIRLKAKLQKEM